MSKFITPLKLQSDGKKWIILEPFSYVSDLLEQMISVPAGFKTDLASVPRVPIVHSLFASACHSAAVIHDWLYATGLVSRKLADEVFLEAMKTNGVPAWRRYPMYAAVRCFGVFAYKGEKS